MIEIVRSPFHEQQQQYEYLQMAGDPGRSITSAFSELNGMENFRNYHLNFSNVFYITLFTPSNCHASSGILAPT